jgi:NAD-dependent DNA ligase
LNESRQSARLVTRRPELGIEQVGETTARASARGYGMWQAFTMPVLAVADEKHPERQEQVRQDMDALDQIGDTVIDAIAAFFGEERRSSSPRRSNSPRAKRRRQWPNASARKSDLAKAAATTRERA